MTREEIEKAAEEYGKSVQFCPHFLTMDKYWCFGCMLDFTAQQINATLGELEIQIENHDGFGVVKTEPVLKILRGLKIAAKG